jgi:hypothetical protein
MKAQNWIDGFALFGLAALLYFGVAAQWWLPRTFGG